MVYNPEKVLELKDRRIAELERERDDAFRKRDDAVALGIELTGKVERLEAALRMIEGKPSCISAEGSCRNIAKAALNDREGEQ